LQCKDEQGLFFFNSQTQQSSDVLPPELAGMAAQLQPGGGQQQQLQAQQRQAQQRLQEQQFQGRQMQAQVQAQQAQQTKQKFTLGPWVVCEDGQGEFYFHTPTGQSFDEPPPELVQLYKAQQQPAARTPQVTQYVQQPMQAQQSYAPQQVTQYVQQPMQAQQSYAPQQGFASAGSYQPQAQAIQYGRQPMQATQSYTPQQGFASAGSYQPQAQAGQYASYTQYGGQR